MLQCSQSSPLTTLLPCLCRQASNK